MIERERLIELLIKGNNQPCGNGNPWEDNYCKGCEYENEKDCRVLQLADYLLEKLNAICPPCEVGDTVYVLSNGTIIKTEVIKVKYEEEAENHGKFIRERIYAVVGNVLQEFNFSDIGKTVYLSEKEAEKALKGDVENE